VVPTFAFASLQHQHLAGDKKASAFGRSSVAEARAAAEEAAALTPHPPLEAPPAAARAAAAAAKAAAAAAARSLRTLRRPPLKGSVEDTPVPGLIVREGGAVSFTPPPQKAKVQLRAAYPRQAAAPSAAAAAAEPDEAESGAGTPKWTQACRSHHHTIKLALPRWPWPANVFIWAIYRFLRPSWTGGSPRMLTGRVGTIFSAGRVAGCISTFGFDSKCEVRRQAWVFFVVLC
jgi:hypothetical protein